MEILASVRRQVFIATSILSYLEESIPSDIPIHFGKDLDLSPVDVAGSKRWETVRHVGPRGRIGRGSVSSVFHEANFWG